MQKKRKEKKILERKPQTQNEAGTPQIQKEAGGFHFLLDFHRGKMCF